MHQTYDGILIQKYKLNNVFTPFTIQTRIFLNLFQLEIMIENAQLIQKVIVRSYAELKGLQVTKCIINNYYEGMMFSGYDKNLICKPYYENFSDFRIINQQYENILQFNKDEMVYFLEKLQNLKCQFQNNFHTLFYQIRENFYQIIREIRGNKDPKQNIMIQLICRIHENVVNKIMQICQSNFQCFNYLDNLEYVYTQIYYQETLKQDSKEIQQILMLQYFETFVDNKLKQHQYIDFSILKQVEYLYAIFDFDQYFPNYSDNLKQNFYAMKKLAIKSFMRQREYYERSLKAIKSTLRFESEISVLDQFCNDSWLPIQRSNYERKRYKHQSDPIYSLIQDGLTDNYEEMLFAYCILVVMNGWNCIQLITNNGRSFYWYDDDIKELNLEEFIFYKQLFGVNKQEQDREVFNLQSLNSDIAKLILSMGDKQYSREQLHNLFGQLSNLQQNQQPSLQLFKQTTEEQINLGLKQSDQ